MSYFSFDRALVRLPSPSVVRGLRAVDRGQPSVQGVQVEQRAYVGALEEAGVAVESLPALEAFPDSLFVEDPALVFAEAAIVLRPGAASRQGEAEEIAPELERRFESVLRMERGTAEGGDVLATPRGVFIGLSARTDRAGAEELSRLLAEIGQRARVVATPAGVLHFKSDCGLLDEETVLATGRLLTSGVFEGFRVLQTPEGEEGAANAVRVGDRVLMSEGYPRTADMVQRAGFSTVFLRTREIAKLDAGLSCLSLRWRSVDA